MPKLNTSMGSAARGVAQPIFPALGVKLRIPLKIHTLCVLFHSWTLVGFIHGLTGFDCVSFVSFSLQFVKKNSITAYTLIFCFRYRYSN